MKEHKKISRKLHKENKIVAAILTKALIEDILKYNGDANYFWSNASTLIEKQLLVLLDNIKHEPFSWSEGDE
jgi:hypothetical protein